LLTRQSGSNGHVTCVDNTVIGPLIGYRKFSSRSLSPILPRYLTRQKQKSADVLFGCFQIYYRVTGDSRKAVVETGLILHAIHCLRRGDCQAQKATMWPLVTTRLVGTGAGSLLCQQGSTCQRYDPSGAKYPQIGPARHTTVSATCKR
jgi:hypothetical protein